MAFIGDTPLVKLQHLTQGDCADVWVKLEGANPTGSMKDRMALSMIEGAERRGELGPGGRVVEYTGGSTGSSLAMVCATHGYAAHFVSSDGFAEEKLQTMRAFGATVEIVHAEGGVLTADVIDRMIARTRELTGEPGTFWPDQVNNPDNKLGYHPMAREILAELGTRVDEFVVAVGGGGCISGNAEVLKEAIPTVRVVGVEPYYVRNVSGGDTSGTHRLEGIGLSFVPSMLRRDLIDEVVPVKDEDAFETARELARREGVLGGITSGANVWAALQRARELGKGKTVVTVIIDTGLRYLAGGAVRIGEATTPRSSRATRTIHAAPARAPSTTTSTSTGTIRRRLRTPPPLLPSASHPHSHSSHSAPGRHPLRPTLALALSPLCPRTFRPLPPASSAGSAGSAGAGGEGRERVRVGGGGPEWLAGTSGGSRVPNRAAERAGTRTRGWCPCPVGGGGSIGPGPPRSPARLVGEMGLEPTTRSTQSYASTN